MGLAGWPEPGGHRALSVLALAFLGPSAGHWVCVRVLTFPGWVAVGQSPHLLAVPSGPLPSGAAEGGVWA